MSPSIPTSHGWPFTACRHLVLVSCLLLLAPLSLANPDGDAPAVLDASAVLDDLLRDHDGSVATAALRDSLARDPERYHLDEAGLTALGYRTIAACRKEDAAEVFQLAAELLPEAANVWDSLGEAWLYLGDAERARSCYQRSLDLNPENENATWKLKDLDWYVTSMAPETDAVSPGAPGTATGLTGPYFGQEPPGRTPQLFAPGLVSTCGRLEYCVVFTPDGREAYFSTSQGLKMSRQTEDGWTVPAPAPFAAPGNFEPHIDATGDRLFMGRGSEIWMREREGDGWSGGKKICDGMFPSLTADGVLYVTDISGGEEDWGRLIRLAPEGDAFGQPELLGGGTNTPESDAHPCVARDGSFLLFDSRRPGALGGTQDGDLYVVFRQADGRWGEAVNLGPGLNDPGDNMCATLSPDGRYLFFTAKWDIYWVRADVIEELRPRPTSR
ncbi:MAG: tetratricopeptide repeat protein [bacterium]|nr:tetratricopeptide repeat protein [bacterium]